MKLTHSHNLISGLLEHSESTGSWPSGPPKKIIRFRWITVILGDLVICVCVASPKHLPSTPGPGDCPDARMHLSLDTMSMVDDSCLSPSNFHELGKGGGVAVGGRVHSIDVILGFSKEQDPLLSPATAPGPHKVNIDSLAETGKQLEPSSHPSYSGHLSSLRSSSGTEQQQYHGESGCCSPSWQSWFFKSSTTF